MDELKAWRTPTMATSSRHFRQPPNSYPCWRPSSKKMETSTWISARQRSSQVETGPLARTLARTLNIGKTKVLAKGPTVDHVFELAKHFLDTDPDLADMTHHFTRDMFTTEGIEVLGSPVDIDGFIKPKTVSKSWKIQKTWISHRWFRSHPTVEILPKYAHTIHQRKH